MKIFVANYGIHMEEGLQQLKKDGYDIVQLTEGNVDVFATDRLEYNLKESLTNNNINENDYLLLSGSPVICSIAATLIKSMTGKLNLMIWGAKSKDYKKRDNVLHSVKI